MRARDYRRRAQDIRAFLDSYGEFISCVERVPNGYSERWVVRSEARSRVD